MSGDPACFLLGIFTFINIELMPANPPNKDVPTQHPIPFDQNVMSTRCPTRLGSGLGLPSNSWQPCLPPLPTLIGPFVLNNYRLRIFHVLKVMITIIPRIITVISKIMAAPPDFNQRLDSKEPMSCQSCCYKKLISIKRSSPSIRFAHQILCLSAAASQMIFWLSSIGGLTAKLRSVTQPVYVRIISNGPYRT